VLRTQSYPDGTSRTGADLYVDDGPYYYADTRAGLPAQIADHADSGGAQMTRELDAAVAALTTPPDVARKRMADSALDPALARLTPEQRRQRALDQLKTMDPKSRKKLQAALSKPPADPRVLEDGNIWTNSLDVLIAGAGRPDVRAGVLRLFGTIPEIDVTRTTVAGHDALDLVAHVFGDGYQEELEIDANTGTPLRFTGRYPGQVPSVVVTYDVSRVNVADIAKG
jgi:hypothetical protein